MVKNMKKIIINHASTASWCFPRTILTGTAAVCLIAFIFVCEFSRLLSRSFVPNSSNEQKNNGFNDGSSLVGVSSETFSGAPYRTFPLKGRFFSGDVPKKKIASKFDRKCEKWGVVTTINAPTQSINNVAQLSGWCLVVVGDKKTPEPYELPLLSGSYFLGENEQEEFCSNFDKFCEDIPWNHFGRKNIGFLYAVAHGATQIWDFDDDNLLLTAAPPQISDGIVLKQVHGENDCQIFNPYPVMGGPTGKEHPSWPRGLPLDIISFPCDVTVEEVQNPLHINVGVVQSLANNEPDVDAIYRLTRGTPFDFDVKHEWFVLGENLLTPYNAQATMIFGSALWSLLLPMTVHSRVSDIWRSYIAQRLMKDIGVQVVFSPPHVRQDRNSHNLLGDLKAEDALYHQATSLCRFLNSWNGATGSLPGRFEELMVALYERGFLEIEDVYMAQKWISALFCAGYKFPTLIDTIDYEDVVIHGSDKKQIPAVRTLPTPVQSEIREPCYRKGNDWSKCAGSHLLYPPSSPLELIGREFMCLYEPLCWKQLDWANMEPPNNQCHLDSSLKFYDWSLHDGTMASVSTQISESMTKISGENLEVFLCNGKRAKTAAKNYHHNFKLCNESSGNRSIPFINSWRMKASESLASAYFDWFKGDKFAQDVDAHIVSFIPTMYDFLMSFNRTLIINVLHRVNIHRCSYEESRRSFENLQRLHRSTEPKHIVAPGYVHDVEYIRHYTGIRPIYLPFSLLGILEHSIENKTYSGSNGKYIWNGHIAVPDTLKKELFVVPRKYELKDLLDYRAVVVLPYSITNTKSVEQYEMNIPILAPSPEFALVLGLYDDRTATYDPYCSGTEFSDSQHPEPDINTPYEFSPNARASYGSNATDELFWISFSEIYLWPCVEYFSSWNDLNEKLSLFTKDNHFQKMSQCMRQANKWRQFEAQSNLCWVLQQVKGQRDKSISSSYREALSSLYNVEKLFG